MDRSVGTCVGVLVGAAVLAASSALIWASAGAGGLHASYTLLEIPLGLVLLGLAVAVIAAGAIAALAGRPSGLEVAGWTAVAMTVGIVLFIAFAESIASLIPGDPIPLTVRRLSLAAGAGPGAWLALVAAAAVACGALESLRLWAASLARTLWDRGPATAAALAVLGVALVLLAQLRQQSWMSAAAFDSHLGIEATAVPWIAPLTYGALLALAVGIVCACARQLEIGAALAAFAGWLTSFCAALVIAGAVAVDGVSDDLVRATSAAWLAFAMGWGVAAAAAALLWESGRE